MSRREPVTKNGYKMLQQELKNLRSVERPKVIQDIAEARAHGDLSENAEYDAAKDKQGFVEGRIKQVEHRLATSEVIDVSELSGDRVVFGATVTLCETDSEKEVSYKIVGVDEADVKSGMISINSPIARGLIGKNLDEEVSIVTPSGTKEYEITDIVFE